MLLFFTLFENTTVLAYLCFEAEPEIIFDCYSKNLVLTRIKLSLGDLINPDRQIDFNRDQIDF